MVDVKNDDKKEDVKKLSEEIEEAVEADAKRADLERQEETSETTEEAAEETTEAEATEATGKTEETTEETVDETDAITDDHLGRAVKAGLTMAEARKFGSAELLESMVSRLETAQKDKADDGEDDGDGEGEDPLAAIPDLDPEEFDEKIVESFKAMKDIIRAQHETIEGLQKAEPSTADWFDGQRGSLDKPVAKAVLANPEKWDEIRGKFDVLVAGYKAAGQDVSRADVLKEAVGITMSDVIAKAANDEKVKKLDKRGKQHIQRPAGNGGGGSEVDDEADIASEIDREFGIKN